MRRLVPVLRIVRWTRSWPWPRAVDVEVARLAGLEQVDSLGDDLGGRSGFLGVGGPARLGRRQGGPEGQEAGDQARGRPGPDQAKVSPQHCVGPFWTGPLPRARGRPPSRARVFDSGCVGSAIPGRQFDIGADRSSNRMTFSAGRLFERVTSNYSARNGPCIERFAVSGACPPAPDPYGPIRHRFARRLAGRLAQSIDRSAWASLS